MKLGVLPHVAAISFMMGFMQIRLHGRASDLGEQSSSKRLSRPELASTSGVIAQHKPATAESTRSKTNNNQAVHNDGVGCCVGASVAGACHCDQNRRIKTMLEPRGQIINI